MTAMRRFCALGALSALMLLSCGREAPVGTLTVTSAPDGASVVLDGAATGDLTPASLLLPVGPHRVAIVAEGYLPTPGHRDVTVNAAGRTEAEFTLTALGELIVTSDPSGAAVTIDGVDTGETTPHTFTATVGEHAVAAVLTGHVAAEGTQTVVVDADVPAAASFTMLTAGSLAVTSTPAGAAIAIDGAGTGESTPHDFTLPIGTHVVRVSRDGWAAAPDSLVVAVAADTPATADFTLQDLGQFGSLAVASTPSGAAILIDGVDSGETTPHLFSLPAGTVSVAVARRGFAPTAAVERTVSPLSEVTADFTLAARKIVLIETMSGVNCVGCPAMNTMLLNLTTTGGYGPDRLAMIKYSMPIGGYDPHYEANVADNQERMNYYYDSTNWNWGVPTLFYDGDLVVEPNGYPDYATTVGLLEASLATDPGFAIAVDVDDFAAAEIAVHVELAAARAVTAADPKLRVVLVENPVVYDEPPGSEGETEFHGIMRQVVTLAAAPLPLAAGQIADFDAALPSSSDWVAENLSVVAFVQDDADLRVLQAGDAVQGVAAAATTREASPR